MRRAFGATMEIHFPHTLTVGDYRSKSALRLAVLQHGYRIADWAEELIKSDWFQVETVEETLELAFVGVQELDPSDLPTAGSVLHAIGTSSEFAPCPPETALQLRMHLRQREGQWFTVVSQPIYSVSKETWSFFALGQEDGYMEIAGSFANPSFPWFRDEILVLRRR